jgi:four helix bundle protein
MAHKFRELTVWQRAMTFVTRVYELTRDYPSHELYGLVSQLRRAAVSIPLNIAEGAGSNTPNEFARFLDIALKSTYETMTALEIAERLTFCRHEQVAPLLDEADEIAAMVVGLGKRMRSNTTVRESPEEYSITDL